MCVCVCVCVCMCVCETDTILLHKSNNALTHNVIVHIATVFTYYTNIIHCVLRAGV